ncbi:MAG TPA: hypothetical protein VL123_02140 [Candidatus Udaeobacter sp.]|jgi:hypothetical protein|nr:hypothetical protein [Candidatus Udaeobacter sp.]
MTARSPAPPLQKTLESQHAALRRAATLRHALRAAATIMLAIALAIALGIAWRMGPSGAWVRLVLVLALSVAALALALLRLRRDVPSFAAFLERIETRFPDLRSLLRNAFDLEVQGSAHTSGELAEALRADAARRFSGVEVRSLRPKVAPLRPALLIAAAAALLVLLTVLWPAAVERSWATLFSPNRAAPPVTLAVEPGSVRLSPGVTLSVRARVTGTRLAPRLDRTGIRREPEAVDEGVIAGSRVWRFDLPPITHDDDYRVRVASVTSPRYHIALSGEPQPVSFEIEYVAPGYARLPSQRGSATRGDLSALRGSRATVEITFDRDVRSLDVHAPGHAPARFESLTPRRWRGTIPVEREGDWELAAGTPTGSARFHYPVRPLPDAPPVIAVRLPEGDLDLPDGQKVPLEVMGEDDLGLSSLELEMHKDAASPWQRVTLARFAGEPREGHVVSQWDAAALGLLPGESATFRFALYDNDAFGRGVARSGSYTVRFPSLGELYKNVSDRQQVAEGALEKVAEQARELQKKLDQLSRQAAATPSSGSFERHEELKSALDRQQDLAQRADQAAQDLAKSLDQAAERRAFSQDLANKLREMQQLVSQVQSPEFREALKKIQQALEKMDSRAAEQALPDWRKRNQEMMNNVDRSIELLKRLREEESLDALAHRADELKRQQDALNQEHEQQDNAKPEGAKSSEDSKNAQSRRSDGRDPEHANADAEKHDGDSRESLAAKQQQAASESQKLGQDVREAGQQASGGEDQKSEMNQAAQELDQDAASAQREAAQSESQGQSGQAKSHGQSASQSISQAHSRLSSLAQKMFQQRQSVDLAAVRRGAQDLLSLQRESEENLSSRQPLEGRADRQTDLSDGVSRVSDSLETLSRRTPFITPKLGQALGRAMQQLSRSGREMSGGDRSEGERAGKSASQALAEAVLELRRTENQMCNNPNSSAQGGQTAGEHMSQLGERQGQLNQHSQQITRRLTEQMRMQAGDEAELRKLGEEQGRIRAELEGMQRDDEKNHELLGRLDAARREMKDVEQTLESGQVGDDLEQKQQRILSRLLDAARSVNRRDFNPERESRPGEDVARPSPAALSPDLLRETDRLRLDLLKAEADRYPAQYRAYIEAYLRALNGTPR